MIQIRLISDLKNKFSEIEKMVVQGQQIEVKETDRNVIEDSRKGGMDEK